MMLVDTSVWIEHFRQGSAKLSGRLSEGLVFMHPCVSGELACGNLKQREEVLRHLDRLPVAKIASDREVRHLIENLRLYGCGIGWIDAQLIASALLSSCVFWTLDKKLAQIAGNLGVA